MKTSIYTAWEKSCDQQLCTQSQISNRSVHVGNVHAQNEWMNESNFYTAWSAWSALSAVLRAQFSHPSWNSPIAPVMLLIAQPRGTQATCPPSRKYSEFTCDRWDQMGAHWHRVRLSAIGLYIYCECIAADRISHGFIHHEGLPMWIKHEIFPFPSFQGTLLAGNMWQVPGVWNTTNSIIVKSRYEILRDLCAQV